MKKIVFLLIFITLSYNKLSAAYDTLFFEKIYRWINIDDSLAMVKSQLDSAYLYSDKSDDMEMYNYNLSYAYYFASYQRYKDAISYYKKSILFAQRAGKNEAVIRSYLNIANAYSDMEEKLPLAIQTAKKGIELFDPSSTDSVYLAHLYSLVGGCYSFIDEFDFAEKYLLLAVDIFKKKNYTNTGRMYYGLFNTYLRKNELDKAKLYLDTMRIVRMQSTELDIEIVLKIYDATLSIAKSDFKNAIDSLSSVEEYLEDDIYQTYKGDIFPLLIKSYKGIGDYSKALIYSEKYSEFLKNANKKTEDNILEQSQNEIQNLQSRLELTALKHDKEISQTKFQFWMLSLSAISLLSLLSAFFLIRNRIKIKQQNEKLEEYLQKEHNYSENLENVVEDKTNKLSATIHEKLTIEEQLGNNLQESEQKFIEISNIIPVGIFVADYEGTITYCNLTMRDIVKNKISIGENIFSLIPSEKSKVIFHDKLLNENSAIISIDNSEGINSAHISISAKILQSNDNKEPKIIGVVSDLYPKDIV